MSNAVRFSALGCAGQGPVSVFRSGASVSGFRFGVSIKGVSGVRFLFFGAWGLGCI